MDSEKIVDNVYKWKTEHTFCAICWVYNNRKNYVNYAEEIKTGKVHTGKL